MSGVNKLHDELKWIDDEESISQRPKDDFPLIGQRTFKGTFLKKLADNLFVPLGLLATTTCLAMGLYNMQKGDSHRQQIFMRGRVFFQAFTLFSMTAGMYIASKKREE